MNHEKRARGGTEEKDQELTSSGIKPRNSLLLLRFRSREKRRDWRRAGARRGWNEKGDQDRRKPNDQENSELEKEFQTPGVGS